MQSEGGTTCWDIYREHFIYFLDFNFCSFLLASCRSRAHKHSFLSQSASERELCPKNTLFASAAKWKRIAWSQAMASVWVCCGMNFVPSSNEILIIPSLALFPEICFPIHVSNTLTLHRSTLRSWEVRDAQASRQTESTRLCSGVACN